MLKTKFLNLSCCLALLAMAGCMSQPLGTKSASAIQDGELKTGESAAPQTEENAALTNPKLANKQAPDKFRVKFETTKGDIVLEVNREWSPVGADRFYNLVDIGYFKDIVIFRAVPDFMFQFGIHGSPAVSQHWSNSNIKDDPRKPGISNEPGTITFAKTGAPNSRSTQMFINLKDNAFLDGQGFTPFGKVVEGMDIVKKINTEYGENPPDLQSRFEAQGNAYVLKRFPNLDIIKSAKVVEDAQN